MGVFLGALFEIATMYHKYLLVALIKKKGFQRLQDESTRKRTTARIDERVTPLT